MQHVSDRVNKSHLEEFFLSIEILEVELCRISTAHNSYVQTILEMILLTIHYSIVSD